MKKITKLFELCKKRDWNISLTYQKINGYSIEIYTGYKTNYKKIAFIDGCLTQKEAVKKVSKFLKDKGKR